MTQERVRELFSYRDGELFWRIRPRKSLDISKPAGTKIKKPDGFKCHICICGKLYFRSRLVFLYHNGYLPKEVDHINRNSFDDRIENLRAASRSLNCKNRGAYSNTGFKHIHYSKEKQRYIFQVYRKVAKRFKFIENAIDYRNRWLKKEKLNLYS